MFKLLISISLSTNKVQKQKFVSVDQFLSSLKEEELQVAEELRAIALRTINVKEKLSYNVQYYFGKKRICFIWPASIKWGGVKEGVAIGFCKGNLLINNSQNFVFDKRLQVCPKIYMSITDINVNVLSSALIEAYSIDSSL